MAGRRDAATVDKSLCRRCQAEQPVITVRTEPLCRVCFCRYVSTKVVKRLETFRVRHSEPGKERTLLLPSSFGASSNALLYILSEHLKGQVERTGRTGFKLHVLHVEDGTASGDGVVHDQIEKVKLRFPDHSYSSCTLSDISEEGDIVSLFDAENTADLSSNGGIGTIFSSLKSATSRADVLQLLRRRIIVNHAKQHGCDSILWADSTTRLAERVLAETAKGRGSSIPWVVADGDSPYGLPFYYPMRELLSKEISSFASLVEPPLDGLIILDEQKPATSTRNTSIDDLMTQYFESVERDYPSIVANVVRTTGKLQIPSLAEVEQQCELCEVPLDVGGAPERSRLCYGCIRTLPQAVG